MESVLVHKLFLLINQINFQFKNKSKKRQNIIESRFVQGNTQETSTKLPKITKKNGKPHESRKNGPRKNGPRKKWSPGKMVPGKNGPRKIGPRETQKRKIVGLATSIVVCVCVCVECWDVIKLWKPKTRQQTQNSKTNPKLGNKKSWGERRASWYVCGSIGCDDQSMTTQNSNTNLPGLL